MKKLLLVITLLISSTFVNADEIYEMQKGSDYLFFLNEKVYSIKSNNPDIITAQRITTYKSNDSQILFSPQKVGKAEVQLTTNKGVQKYTISIKNGKVKTNDTFLKLDIPGMLE